MALYALGDLHLGFQVNKPMDRFGKVWKHHERKIERFTCKSNGQARGTHWCLPAIIPGEESCGRCREDLAFIAQSART